MAFAEGPFYLLPSRKPSLFYLGSVGVFFFSLQIVPEKQELCFFILRAEAKEMCGHRLGGDNMTE